MPKYLKRRKKIMKIKTLLLISALTLSPLLGMEEEYTTEKSLPISKEIYIDYKDELEVLARDDRYLIKRPLILKIEKEFYQNMKEYLIFVRDRIDPLQKNEIIERKNKLQNKLIYISNRYYYLFKEEWDKYVDKFYPAIFIDHIKDIIGFTQKEVREENERINDMWPSIASAYNVFYPEKYSIENTLIILDDLIASAEKRLKLFALENYHSQIQARIDAVLQMDSFEDDPDL